jgi:hypothetical protein
MIVELALVVIASGGTTVWHELTHRHREIKHHRELCNHVWEEPFEVKGTGTWKQFCIACGEQRFCDPDDA